jgi:hypothetical protein
MRIANPIYDVVFKYLLDDEKVAKLMLSALLAREVVELKCRATEVRHEIPSSVLVLRLDFSATVRLEDGTRKVVLIEIQKAHNSQDIMRFRRYLGAEYAARDNVHAGAGGLTQPLPIVTIYFLGEGLDRTPAPVVRVDRLYHDAATGEVIPIPEPFIEALTHDCIVVQIDRLRGRRRTDLERLLMVFDQGLAEPSNPQLLDLLEEDYPEPYREVFRRLLRAIAEKSVRDGMDVEDDYLATLLDSARSLAEKDKALEAGAKVLEEKDKALEQKDRTLAEQDRTLAEKDRALAEQASLIAALRRRLEAG